MLEVLRRIIQEVASTQDFRAALNVMVQRIAETLDAHASSIFLLDRRKGEYLLMATAGLNPLAVGKVRIPMNQGLISFVGEREEPVNLDDARKHERFLHVPEVHEEAYQAFLGVPIIYQRQVLGVLAVQQKEATFYDQAEEAFLATLATQLAAVVAHAEATGAISPPKEAHLETCDAMHSGIPGAPGVAIGHGVVVFPMFDLDAIPDREPDNVEEEIELLESALAAAQEDFRLLGERLTLHVPEEERALFEAYERLLDHDSLGVEIIAEIRCGNWAQGALRNVIKTHVERIASLEDAYLSDRTTDIKDLGSRVLMHLQRSDPVLPDYHEKTILIGEELTATDLAAVPKDCLAGVISGKGSSSSHIAILARAMGVPTVMGVSEMLIHDLADQEIIVDGYYGQIYINPKAPLLQEFQILVNEEEALDESLKVLRDKPAETKDKHRVILMVNTGLGADVGFSLSVGAEGVGLYRTEIPFMMRDRFPSAEEQRIIYRQLLTSFAPLPVTMRTLDIGGDKSLPYFPVVEENPFLGWRGIRITLDHPDIFLVQARAMMRASENLNNLRIMLPMISDVSEADEALRLLKKSYLDVRAEGFNIEMPQVGVMIEVPSAVYQARSLAKRVDFLSVGSNDLTQYILAVDRNNSRVANLYDPLHPAVLRALMQVVEGGHQEGKHVSICGEMAGDPAIVILLLAMGFDSLSMSASSISRMKWVIRQFTQKKAAKLLQDVLGMESAVMIRCHLELALERAGLGSLVRAGR